MIRKTMRVGAIRTSIKLESEFWACLKDMADERGIRLSTLVNQIAEAMPDKGNLASTLRKQALGHARRDAQEARSDRERLAMAGNTQDLTRVLENCPWPCLVLDRQRTIQQVNRAFASWLNVDLKATLGQRLDNVMLLRGPGLRDLWAGLGDGRLQRGGFTAVYVSPGKVRTAQATVVALGVNGAAPDQTPHGCVVLFETLPGRS